MISRGLFALGLVLATGARAHAAGDLPGAGFPADRYSTLWTKSPFAIATPDAAETSPDYSLVGVAQFDGVTYVSLIDRKSQEHFVLSSDKPVRNLTLVSVAHGPTGTSALIQRNGETLALRQEQGPVAAAASPDATNVAETIRPVAGGPPSSVGGIISPAYITPPRVRVHRFPIAVPPRPRTAAQQQQIEQQRQAEQASQPPPQSPPPQ